MKKKIAIILGIIIAILLAIGVMYLTDRHMMKNNKPVVFSTWGYNYAPPETTYEILEIMDKTKDTNYTCAMALEKIYEDDTNEYYFNCIKSQDIIVKYINGYEENVKVALNKGHITLKDLDTFGIGYMTEKKETEKGNNFVGTVLEETTTYIIVEPDENESERKSADKIVINKDHKDYLYGIGTKVKVYYDGQIMETYPVRINANSVYVLN